MKASQPSRADERQPESAPSSAPVLEPRSNPLLGLQRTVGNQAALRYLQRKCSCGGTCSNCQSKSDLPIGPANDRYEREADQTAARIMRMSAPSAPVVRRKCSQCEEDEEQAHKRVQRSATGPGPEFAPSTVHEVLRSP